MKVLIISAHPSQESFLCTVRDDVVSNIIKSDVQVRHHDLYAENFNPVFSAYERLNHVGDIAVKLQDMPDLAAYVQDLQWCDTVIFFYPTWWSGQPAILKGWIDRVLLNDVAWTLPQGAARIKPLLTNIRRVVVVTTHGSSKFVNALQGESGKRTMFRSVRAMFSPRARCHWIAMYGMDRASEGQREKFIRVVRGRVSKILHIESD